MTLDNSVKLEVFPGPIDCGCVSVYEQECVSAGSPAAPFLTHGRYGRQAFGREIDFEGAENGVEDYCQVLQGQIL